MIIRDALLLAAITFAAGGFALAQSTVAPPQSGQSMQGMGNMPGMSGGSSADMTAMMKQCAQMKAGMKMTPDMQPMMDRCGKMDASMGATKAPDDTLSR